MRLTKAIMICSLIVNALFANNPISLNIGIYQNKPKIFIDENNNPSGFHIDILNDIAKKENWHINYLQCQWSECLAMLKNGQLDVMPDVAYSKQREKQFLFSNETIFSSWSYAYTHKGTNLKSILDFKDMNIAVLKGSIQHESIKKTLDEYNITPLRYIEVPTWKKGFELLKKREVDLLLINRFYELQNSIDPSIVKTDIVIMPSMVKYAFSPSNQNLIPIFDTHLKNLKDDKDSIYYKATQKWLTKHEKQESLPTWIIWTLLFTIAIIVLLSFIIFLFKRLVKKQTKELSHQIAFLESYQMAIDKSSVVSKSDIDGNITYVNENFCKITGYKQDEIIGKPYSIIRDPNAPKELWETIKAKKVWKGILKNRGKLGEYWVDATILPILDEDKNIVEYMAIRHDITKMVEQQQVLNKLANTDTLTGLYNRNKLSQDIKNSASPALAVLNIDNFTQINDFYGHNVGDMVIKEVGNIIQDKISSDGYNLYHLQGDEYVLFNANITKGDFIDKLNELGDFVSTMSVIHESEKINFNFSLGVSFESKENLLQTADMALKIAKKDNQYLVIYSDKISLAKQYENNIMWTKKIKEAIENDKFIPVFQPIVNNETQIWDKYECLVRMEDEDKLISPYFFLEISKKTKHYKQITKTMIAKSFEVFKDKDVEFSINLTIEDIIDADMNQYILRMLESYKIGSRVVFEIVESESIKNFEEVSTFIKNVKSYQCKIAIDDFGTGYSNFEYLLKLKADFLKIDGSLIKNIDTNKDTQLVVSTVVTFAKKMGMKTIAEFVENESIFNTIKELGIDYSQGYYFSEPNRTLKPS